MPIYSYKLKIPLRPEFYNPSLLAIVKVKTTTTKYKLSFNDFFSLLISLSKNIITNIVEKTLTKF